MKLASWSARSTLHSLPGSSQPRGDDRAAAARGRRDALLERRAERHAVAVAEVSVAGHSRRACSPRSRRLGALGQPDHHEPPLDLVAVAPVEHAEGRDGGVGPRAARVGVERGADADGHVVLSGWGLPSTVVPTGAPRAAPATARTVRASSPLDHRLHQVRGPAP